MDTRWKISTCAAPMCSNNRNTEKRSFFTRKSFFNFPKEPKRCSKWLRFCGLEDHYRIAADIPDSVRVCVDHFLESDYYRFTNGIRLHSNAVPSVHANGTVVPSSPKYPSPSPSPPMSQVTISPGNSPTFRHHMRLRTYNKRGRSSSAANEDTLIGLQVTNEQDADPSLGVTPERIPSPTDVPMPNSDILKAYAGLAETACQQGSSMIDEQLRGQQQSSHDDVPKSEGTLFTTIHHIKCENLDTEHEDGYFSVTNIKTEPQDIQNIVKTEEEEYDKSYPSFHLFASMSEKSKLYKEEYECDKFTEHINIKQETETFSSMKKISEGDPLKLESLESDLTSNMSSILPPESISMPETQNSQENEISNKSSKPTERQTPMDGPVAAVEVEADTDKNNIPGQPFNANTLSVERPHKCTQCRSAFKTLYHLKGHLKRFHFQKSLSCTFCERTCSTFSAIKAHMKAHVRLKDLSCNVCGYRFTRMDSLMHHMVLHNEERYGARGNRHIAVIRLTAEQTRVLAQKPLHQATSISEEVLIASAAEKDRINEIKDPNEQYNMEPIYSNKCNYCPKSFRKPSDLIRHIRIHTGEKPYQCSYCNKSFAIKSTLHSHLKTHRQQKLFPCHVCGCSFSTKGSLKVHMRLHTGAKPFKCSLCEMRFRTSGHRKAHIMIHMKNSGDSKAGSQLASIRSHNKLEADQEKEAQSQEKVTELENPSATIKLEW